MRPATHSRRTTLWRIRCANLQGPICASARHSLAASHSAIVPAGLCCGLRQHGTAEPPTLSYRRWNSRRGWLRAWCATSSGLTRVHGVLAQIENLPLQASSVAALRGDCQTAARVTTDAALDVMAAAFRHNDSPQRALVSGTAISHGPVDKVPNFPVGAIAAEACAAGVTVVSRAIPTASFEFAHFMSRSSR